MADSQKERAIEAIRHKLVGYPLQYEDAYALMQEFSSGGLGDIFIAYFAASGFRNGFSDDELFYLTKAMVETGKRLPFKGIVADKHSIGGMPGTRATMIVVPIIAAAGYCIPKTSSRAITTPAGTADCMEVLAPVTFSIDEATAIVKKTNGCIIWGGHIGMAPADDVIIRVEEPLGFESYDKVLISILAKKIAAGASHLVLDIPVGPTMKIKYVKDALAFRDKFTAIAKRFSIRVQGDINFQLQPAGMGIGPSYEAADAARVLLQTPDRPRELEWKALRLASELLDMCFAADNRKEDALMVAEYLLRSGEAAKKFRAIIKAQGGNGNFTISELPKAQHHTTVTAAKAGVVESINSHAITAIAKVAGAPEKHTAGLILHKRVNDAVKKGEELFTIYSPSKQLLAEAHDTAHSMPPFALSVAQGYNTKNVV